MSFWNLPPSPPEPPFSDIVQRMYAVSREAARHREELAVLEEVCKLAFRDNRKVFVTKRGGRVVDAVVVPWLEGREMYITDLDRIDPDGLVWD